LLSGGPHDRVQNAAAAEEALEPAEPEFILAFAQTTENKRVVASSAQRGDWHLS